MTEPNNQKAEDQSGSAAANLATLKAKSGLSEKAAPCMYAGCTEPRHGWRGYCAKHHATMVQKAVADAHAKAAASDSDSSDEGDKSKDGPAGGTADDVVVHKPPHDSAAGGGAASTHSSSASHSHGDEAGGGGSGSSSDEDRPATSHKDASGGEVQHHADAHNTPATQASIGEHRVFKDDDDDDSSDSDNETPAAGAGGAHPSNASDHSEQLAAAAAAAASAAAAADNQHPYHHDDDGHHGGGGDSDGDHHRDGAGDSDGENGSMSRLRHGMKDIDSGDFDGKGGDAGPLAVISTAAALALLRASRAKPPSAAAATAPAATAGAAPAAAAGSTPAAADAKTEAASLATPNMILPLYVPVSLCSPTLLAAYQKMAPASTASGAAPPAAATTAAAAAAAGASAAPTVCPPLDRAQRNHKIKQIPFVDSFEQTVKGFISSRGISFRQTRMLKSLSRPVSVDSFTYDSPAQLQVGRECLLSLWAKLLECIDVDAKTSLSPLNAKEVYDMIICLIGRHEFDCQHLNIDQLKKQFGTPYKPDPQPTATASATHAASHKDDKTAPAAAAAAAHATDSKTAPHDSKTAPAAAGAAASEKPDDYVITGLPAAGATVIDLSSKSVELHGELQCWRVYRMNLVQTLRLIFRAYQWFDDKRAVPVPYLSEFCAQVLAMSYFRLPILSSFLLNAACPLDTLQTEKEKKARADRRAKLASDGRAQLENDYFDIDGKDGRNPVLVAALGPSVEGDEFGEFDADIETNMAITVKTVARRSSTSIAKLNRRFKQNLIADLTSWVNSETARHKSTPAAAHTKFQNDNPSLYVWSLFVDDEEKEHEKTLVAVRVRELLLKKLGEVSFFCEFVRCLITYVDTGAAGDVPWSTVPGYLQLVQAFIKRMLGTPPAEYPFPLIKCQRELLRNSDTVSFFVRAALGQTPSTDREQINKVLDLVDVWLRTLGTATTEEEEVRGLKTGASTPLPVSFCYPFFNKAVSMLLQSEHYQILLKGLTFIYTHCGRFYGPPRVKLFDELIFENFYRLFLHWCPEVRKLFHFILIFKLNRSFMIPGEARRVRPSIDTATDKIITAALAGAAAASAPADAAATATAKPATASATGADGAPVSETLTEAEFDAAMGGQRNIRHAAAGEDGDNKKSAEDEFGPCSMCKTILNHEELKTDALFGLKTQQYLGRIRAQAANPAVRHFSHHLRIYARDSIAEYHKQLDAFNKLQAARRADEEAERKERAARGEPMEIIPSNAYLLWAPDLSFDMLASQALG